jgi:hypothetical protein
MKINLLWGNGDPISGYVNIDPHSYDKENVTNGDVTNLDDIVEDSEATEILAGDIIDYLPFDLAIKAIGHWTKKLRHKGKLTVGGNDLYEISKIFAQRAIDLKEALDILHGTQHKPWEFKASHTTVSDLAEVLEAHGLTVLKKRVNGFRMVVEAVRP